MINLLRVNIENNSRAIKYLVQQIEEIDNEMQKINHLNTRLISEMPVIDP
jgi:hypothetical protein